MWSIEAAVESGRLAARVIEPGVRVIPQYKPRWLRALGAMDDVFYSAGLPHVLHFLLGGLVLALSAAVLRLLL